MPEENGTNNILLQEITPRNMLSFGPDTSPIILGGLNVLIGPNGSGKSNLVDAIALLRATASDLRVVVRQGGGVQEWIWKGKPDNVAALEAVISNPKGSQPLRHQLAFRSENQAFQLEEERIENQYPDPGKDSPYSYYRYEDGLGVIEVQDVVKAVEDKHIQGQSIIYQRRAPEIYPQISYLAEVYEKIRIYREWSFGRNTIFRTPQQADQRNDRIEEDFSNLGLFLNRLRRNPKAKAALLQGLQDLYEGLDDVDVSVEGGTVQVFFTEGNFTIPATRLSDGTLRYLCLLAILHDPNPPPLVCIEEPELGLHPDILPTLADLLLAASERTQLIVTTHSPILVDALTEYPQSVLVCEKHEGQTQIERLDADHLKEWLEKYRLGELWTRGELGGTRW